MDELKDRLLSDIELLGIELDFDLIVKPYSKTFYGRYDPNTRRVFLYAYKGPKCITLYPYKDLFYTTLHEVVHHLQWSDPNFVRVRGVMHDPQFYRMYNRYKAKARALFLRREVIRRVAC